MLSIGKIQARRYREAVGHATHEAMLCGSSICFLKYAVDDFYTGVREWPAKDCAAWDQFLRGSLCPYEHSEPLHQDEDASFSGWCALPPICDLCSGARSDPLYLGEGLDATTLWSYAERDHEDATVFAELTHQSTSCICKSCGEQFAKFREELNELEQMERDIRSICNKPGSWTQRVRDIYLKPERNCMKAPKTMPELREALGYIMAGAINGDVKTDEGRMALNAATRIIESIQAETRMRALAFAMNATIEKEMPLASGALVAPKVERIE